MVTAGIAARKNRVKEGMADRIFCTVNYILLTLILLSVLYPLVYVLSASISDPVLVNNGTMWLLPKGITFEGYRRVFQDPEILTGYRNTIFYTVAGTAINLFFTILTAYPLSRKDFFGRNVFTFFFSFTMFFGGGMIPTYLLIRDLHLIDSVWVMLIPGAISMWNVVLCRTFFQSSIPEELKEAAMLDGCNHTKFLLWVVIPLSAPIIAVLAMYYGVGHWNAFFEAMIYLSDAKLYPLQLILRELLVQQQMSAQMLLTDDNVLAMAEQAKIADSIKYALIIVSSLPILMVYPFLQKYFAKGVMVGALKG